MKKKRMYVYPITARFNTGLYNPYVDDLIEALSPALECVNRNHPSHIGVFNILKYWRETDVFFLNWIEDLPDKKGGIVQMMFLLLLFPFIKLSGKVLVWTVHNKRSHHGKHLWLKKWFMRRLMYASDLMLTHAREGINYVKEETNEANALRVFYFAHPVKLRALPARNGSPLTTDVLIWGTMARYKGIDKFLKFLHEHELQHCFKIRVMGKIPDDAYKDELKQYANSNISITDKFVSNEELNKAMAESACILFTYSPEYVLSSGVLADSIGALRPVVGPRAGAFTDLEAGKLVLTYENFEECVAKITELKASKEQAILNKDVTRIKEYSWEAYANKIVKWLGISLLPERTNVK